MFVVTSVVDNLSCKINNIQCTYELVQLFLEHHSYFNKNVCRFNYIQLSENYFYISIIIPFTVNCLNIFRSITFAYNILQLS